jgi:tetratricopeptide (TPR) repeat protein
MADAQESNFFAGIILTHTFLSFLYSDLGHFQLAIDMVNSAFDDQRIADTALIKSFFSGAELLTRVRAGKIDEAENLISQEDFSVDQMNFFARQYAQLAMCYMSFIKGDYESTIQKTSDFLQQLQSNGVEYLTPELLLLIARSQIAQNLWNEAANTLKIAQSKIDKLGSRRSRWQVDYLLGRFALNNGNLSQAHEYFTNAKTTLSYILEHISDGELRGYFLKREEVRAVFDAVDEAV